MSHFLVGVIIPKTTEPQRIKKQVEAMLQPFDENLTLPRYIEYTKEQLIEKGKKEIQDYKESVYDKYLADPEAYAKTTSNPAHLGYVKNEFPKKLQWTDEEIYQEEIKWDEPEDITPEGGRYSTSNPKSKWDWWRIGGRWDGVLSLDGEFIKDPEDKGFNFGDEHEELHNNAVFISKLPKKSENVPYALITPDGEWLERGEMGWFGMAANEKDKDSWDEQVWKILEKYQDYLIVGVDCHI